MSDERLSGSDISGIERELETASFNLLTLGAQLAEEQVAARRRGEHGVDPEKDKTYREAQARRDLAYIALLTQLETVPADIQ